MLNKEFQAVDCAGISTIFVAKSHDLIRVNEIFIWRKKSKGRFNAVGIVCAMLVFLQLFFVVVVVAFVYVAMPQMFI